MTYWVYILRCSDGSYYTGRTTDIDSRLWEHNAGLGGKYTMKRRPVTLMNCWLFENEEDAYAAEFQIKGWRREKKEALIREDFDLLKELARSYSSRRKGRLSTL